MIEALMQLFGENSIWLAQLTVGAAAAVAVSIFIQRFRPRLLRGQAGSTPPGRVARLGIIDSITLDHRRQLLLVRRDGVEHLILTGGPSDMVIESAIPRTRARAVQPPVTAQPNPAPIAAATPVAATATGAAASTIERMPAAARDHGPIAVESGSALPFPFLPIQPSRPAASPGNGHNASDIFKRPGSAFAPASDGASPNASSLRSAGQDSGPASRSSGVQAAGASPVWSSEAPRTSSDKGNGTTQEQPAEGGGDLAAHKISALEAEMNRLLGQIAADRRSF
jgi:hypothetical protein